jgi:hypothetical protein
VSGASIAMLQCTHNGESAIDEFLFVFDVRKKVIGLAEKTLLMKVGRDPIKLGSEKLAVCNKNRLSQKMHDIALKN